MQTQQTLTKTVFKTVVIPLKVVPFTSDVNVTNFCIRTERTHHLSFSVLNHMASMIRMCKNTHICFIHHVIVCFVGTEGNLVFSKTENIKREKCRVNGAGQIQLIFEQLASVRKVSCQMRSLLLTETYWHTNTEFNTTIERGKKEKERQYRGIEKLFFAAY